jgi:hypothetical protein
MHQMGYESMWHSGDKKAVGFAKQVDNISVHCKVFEDEHRPGHWQFTMKHMPGVQLTVQLSTEPAQFPHPKFHRWERSMFRFANACAPVAETAAEVPAQSAG